jgi:hypothetical protein
MQIFLKNKRNKMQKQTNKVGLQQNQIKDGVDKEPKLSNMALKQE